MATRNNRALRPGYNFTIVSDDKRLNLRWRFEPRIRPTSLIAVLLAACATGLHFFR